MSLVAAYHVSYLVYQHSSFCHATDSIEWKMCFVLESLVTFFGVIKTSTYFSRGGNQLKSNFVP